MTRVEVDESAGNSSILAKRRFGHERVKAIFLKHRNAVSLSDPQERVSGGGERSRGREKTIVGTRPRTLTSVNRCSHDRS